MAAIQRLIPDRVHEAMVAQQILSCDGGDQIFLDQLSQLMILMIHQHIIIV